MARPLLGIFLWLILAGTAAADAPAALAAMRQGGHVALMRHADAPGTADPEGFRVDLCATQRNLSARGRADATTAGERLRAQGVGFDKVLSSPWCRCLDTARLMDMGPVEAVATFGNPIVLRDQREELVAGARKVVEAWRGPGTLLIVTHGALIGALTGHHPSSGEIVVVAPATDGRPTVVGRIEPAAD